MRRAYLSLLPLFALGGCMVPRPWLAPAPDSCAVEPASGETNVLVVSFRATDCRGRPQPRFTAYRSEEPHYALATIPDEKHMAYRLVGDMAWDDALKASVDQLGPPIIYIHGYANTQDFAVRRAATIGATLLRPRPVIAITWPSYAKILPYPFDEANNAWVQPRAREVIGAIAKTYKGSILIAHSMGNHILIDSLTAPGAPPPNLAQVILASPDVDRDGFARLLKTPDGLGMPATVYASTRDQALSASWRTHGNARAGDLSQWFAGRRRTFPYTEVNSAVIVDTSLAEGDVKRHGDFIESLQGAADLCRVISGLSPAVGRTPIAGAAYFELRREIVEDDCTKQARMALGLKPPKQRENGGRGKD